MRKKIAFLLMVMAVLGCAHSHRHRKAIRQSQDGIKTHTAYVLEEIYSRIDRSSSRRAGRVYISADWFRQQGLSEEEKNKVFADLEANGYSCDVNAHYNSFWNRYQDDILISW